jgi:hypothetical protein
MPLEERVLAGDLVAGIVAPVLAAWGVLGVRNRQCVIVDAAGRDEDDVRPATEGAEEGLDVLAEGGRVGHVHDSVEGLGAEKSRQRPVGLAVPRDGGHARGKALGMAPAVEDGDGVAAAQERPDEVKADELGPAEHEDPHHTAPLSRSRRRRRWWCA